MQGWLAQVAVRVREKPRKVIKMPLGTGDEFPEKYQALTGCDVQVVQVDPGPVGAKRCATVTVGEIQAIRRSRIESGCISGRYPLTIRVDRPQVIDNGKSFPMDRRNLSYTTRQLKLTAQKTNTAVSSPEKFPF